MFVFRLFLFHQVPICVFPLVALKLFWGLSSLSILPSTIIFLLHVQKKCYEYGAWQRDHPNKAIPLIHVRMHYWPSVSSRWLNIAYSLSTFYVPTLSQGQEQVFLIWGQYLAILTDQPWLIKDLLICCPERFNLAEQIWEIPSGQLSRWNYYFFFWQPCLSKTKDSWLNLFLWQKLAAMQ